MYLALYRKYRPDNFDDLIGQDHITKALKNQIKNDAVAHAYLFCGSRGTGKTTAAKIFSRAINCEANKNGSPCNKCAACKALSDASNMDVIEIDAASNNRVDEVRELREKAKYPPVSSRFKVYIIDEVHMLTESAFNALLKTLEEPPKHVVFILATTEAHKLPATILSRVLRFDFKLLSKGDIEKLLKKVFKQAGIACDDAALAAIAAAGEGSVRDALSVADMCAAFGDNNIVYKDVLSVLGASDKQTVIKLAHAVLNSDAAKFLKDINDFADAGKNISALAKDLALYFRDLIMIKTLPNANKTLQLPEDVFGAMKADSAVDLALLNACMQTFSKAGIELKFATDPLLTITAAAMDIIAGGESSKKKLMQADEPKSVAASVPKLQVTQSPAQNAGKQADARKIWGEVVIELNKRGLMLLYPICGGITNVSLEGNNFVITANSAQEQKLLKKEQNIADLLATFERLGYTYKITVGFEEKLTKSSQKSTEDKLREKFGSILKIS